MRHDKTMNHPQVGVSSLAIFLPLDSGASALDSAASDRFCVTMMHRNGKMAKKVAPNQLFGRPAGMADRMTDRMTSHKRGLSSRLTAGLV